MKTNILSLAAAAALSVTVAGGAQAMSRQAQCLSSDVVDFDGSVVDAALATPELSTLVDAVVTAGLDDALATTDNITVYAPTNDAFAAVPGPILDTIVGDVDVLTAVLTYHVTPGRMDDPRKYYTPVRRPTLQGQLVYYSYKGGPMVNNAAVNCQGVQTDNGIVWIIDSVLLPNL